MLNFLLYNNFLCPGEKQVHFHNVLKVLYFRALILYLIY